MLPKEYLKEYKYTILVIQTALLLFLTFLKLSNQHVVS